MISINHLQILEEENTNLKEKVSVLKDKLTEATNLIDNLTEQIMSINNECGQLKGKVVTNYCFLALVKINIKLLKLLQCFIIIELLGKSEQAKAHLSVEMEGLRKELFEKDSKRENLYEDIKSKVQHWKVSIKQYLRYS